VVLSFSIHLPLCSTGVTRLPRYYEEIRLLWGRRPVVVASFGSTARAGSHRSPWVRTLDVPSLLPPLPSGHDWILGVTLSGALTRPESLHRSSHYIQSYGTPRASSPHGLAVHAVASSSRLLPTRPAKDFHLQSSAHARHTTKGRALWKPSLIPCTFGVWNNNDGFQRPPAFDGSRAAPLRDPRAAPLGLRFRLS
jgi:hypothetical protein